MPVAAAVWCVACGAVPDVAITIERNGVLAHYGACWDHVAQVASRARGDVQLADERPVSGSVLGADGQPAIEVQADG